MTTYISEDFEGGSDGVAISTANSNTDQVGGSGSAPTFTTDSYSGSLAMSVNQVAAASSSLRFPLGASRNVVYVGVWIKAAAWPTGNWYPLATREGSTIRSDVRMPSGVPAMRGGDTGVTLVWTGDSALPTGQWIYIEHRLDAGAGNQSFKAWAADGTPLVDSGVWPWAAATAVDNVVMGAVTSVANQVFVMDNFSVGDVSAAPAEPEPLDTPVVTVTAVVQPSGYGETDGTVTVQWDAITGADSYEAGIAEGLNQTSGFTTKSTSATSPYTFTGLAAGTYTVAVRAHPPVGA